MKRVLICFLVMVCGYPALLAQDYSGVTGMIHVPTAEMATEGEARIGFFFLNKEFLPDTYQYEGEKFNTTNHFLAITPFSWIELSYVCTLMKGRLSSGKVGHYFKDRHFGAKIRPLKEGKWWPAIAIGMQDIGHAPTNEELGVDGAYFQNIFLTASKHFVWERHEFGVHLAYRYYTSDFNEKWRGIAGGITYRPAFAPQLRVLAEYTGSDINLGMDYLLWRYFFLQASLQDGKYFSGGICLKVNLLGKRNQSK